MKNIIWILTIIICSCARVQTLNLEKHQYSKRPDHIIWIQLAGFSSSHLPLIKFNYTDSNLKTALEEMDCAGNMWRYNLYTLRPTAEQSFRSQLMGSKNINGSCADLNENMIWKRFYEQDYKITLLEVGTNATNSLEKMYNCENENNIMSNLRFFKMGNFTKEMKDDKGFHFQESKNVRESFAEHGRYFDRSCKNERCYSSLFNNFKMIFNESIRDSKTFTLIYDFNFYNSLKKKDISEIKENFLEIEKILSYLKNYENKNTLVLVTGSDGQPLEFPTEGKEWTAYEKSGVNLSYKTPELMSPVFAKGSMAENFCGIFEEAEINFRLNYKPTSKKFDWDLINPF